MALTEAQYTERREAYKAKVDSAQATLDTFTASPPTTSAGYYSQTKSYDAIDNGIEQISNLDSTYAAEQTELDLQSSIAQSAIVYWIKSRYIDSGDNFTSQWGTPNNVEHATNSLIVVSQCSLKGYNNTNEVTGAYAHFMKPPEIRDTTAIKGDLGLFSEEKTGHDDGNSRNYAPTMEAAIALRNTTAADIVVPIILQGTSYSSYTPLCVNMFTPNSGTNTEVTDVSFQNLTSYTSSAATNRNVNVTIPAGKTVILHFVSSFRQHDSLTGAYNYIGQFSLEGFQNMFPQGIELDKQVMKNINPTRGYQISSPDGTITGIWTAVDPATST